MPELDADKLLQNKTGLSAKSRAMQVLTQGSGKCTAFFYSL
jgi:hypothetical protein